MQRGHAVLSIFITTYAPKALVDIASAVRMQMKKSKMERGSGKRRRILDGEIETHLGTRPTLGRVPLDIWRAILYHPSTPLLLISRFSQTCRRFQSATRALGWTFLRLAEDQRREDRITEARLNLFKAALCRNTRAMLHLGWIAYQSFGWGFDMANKTRPLKIWFQKAYDYNGSLVGGAMCVHMDYDRKLHTRYVQKITRAIKHSKNTDPFVRGLSYYCGIGFRRRSEQKALEWFQKALSPPGVLPAAGAAGEDDEYTLAWLGEFHRHHDVWNQIFGVRTITDRVERQIYYFTKAAQLGSADAQLRLAFIYKRLDFVKYEYWKAKATKQGCGRIIDTF